MSEASELTVHRTESRPRFLSDVDRQAIVAEVAKGYSQQEVAQRFNVHRNTVNSLVRAVKKSAQSGTFTRAADWKRELYETMVPQSVEALRLSITDKHDVHKAAGTAMQHLKAVGVVASEASGSTVNIYVNTQDLPQDWHSRARFIDEGDAPEMRNITPPTSE